jgi:predicted MFS family arabinose efflux permease
MVTAPLTVVFVKQSFGSRHLGALTGLITMVHQVFGGLGAYFGAAVFDTTGTYDRAFVLIGVVSLAGVILTLMLKRQSPASSLA